MKSNRTASAYTNYHSNIDFAQFSNATFSDYTFPIACLESWAASKDKRLYWVNTSFNVFGTENILTILPMISSCNDRS